MCSAVLGESLNLSELQFPHFSIPVDVKMKAFTKVLRYDCCLLKEDGQLSGKISEWILKIQVQESSTLYSASPDPD